MHKTARKAAHTPRTIRTANLQVSIAKSWFQVVSLRFAQRYLVSMRPALCIVHAISISRNSGPGRIFHFVASGIHGSGQSKGPASYPNVLK